MKRFLIILFVFLFVAAALVVSYFALTVIDPAVSPTCTETGLTEGKHLQLLNITIEKQQEIPALGHDYIHHEGKEATCTEPGFEAYDTCSRCDYSSYAEIPSLGHNLVRHEGKEATCTEPGFEAYDTCSRCDYTTYADIPALGHDIIHHEGKTITCTEPGYEPYDTCSRCDYSTYKEIPVTGHNFVGYTCEKCGLDYAVFCKVGKKTTAKVSNDNVGYNFYHSQHDTGRDSEMNCGPTCVYMACKWADPDFSTSVANIRKKYVNGGGWWYPNNIYSSIVSFGIDADYYDIPSYSSTYNSTTIKQIRSFIDDGKLLIVCFYSGGIYADRDNQGVVGKGYRGSAGHFVLIKGYWVVDGKTYFEIYDPWLSLDYYNPILGTDRTRYYDAIELANSTHEWNPTVVVISRKTA